MNIQLSDINLAKGNIPINSKLFNKYKNVEDIFNSLRDKYQEYNSGIILPSTIPELEEIDLNELSKTEIQNLAIKVFNKYHDINVFYNDENKITISNKDIKESAHKIINSNFQKGLLKEHLIIIANVNKVINKSILINQTDEHKNRLGNNLWSYYLVGLKINSKKYLLLFDIISRDDGENHYRIQRLELIS